MNGLIGKFKIKKPLMRWLYFVHVTSGAVMKLQTDEPEFMMRFPEWRAAVGGTLDGRNETFRTDEEPGAYTFGDEIEPEEATGA